MKSFNDTRDPIEIIFKNRILKRFPNYAIFWETFIGFREDKLPNPCPYGLIFPESYDVKEKQRVEKSYLTINMICHHLFCSLAIAEDSLDNYLRNIPRKPTPNAYFESFYSLNGFYLNLGICRDMINRLIAEIIVNLLKVDLQIEECDTCNNRKPGYLDAFIPYLEKEDSDLVLNFKEWKSRIGRIRSRLNHQGRPGIVIKKDGEYMPKHLPRKADWKNDHDEVINKGNGIRVTDAMEKDLEDSEKIINALFDIFIIKLKSFFDKEGISVNYPQ